MKYMKPRENSGPLLPRVLGQWESFGRLKGQQLGGG